MSIITHSLYLFSKKTLSNLSFFLWFFIGLGLGLLYQQAFGLEDDGSVVVETVDVLSELVHLLDEWLYVFILEQSLAVAVVLQIVNQIAQFVLRIGDAIEDESKTGAERRHLRGGQPPDRNGE